MNTYRRRAAACKSILFREPPARRGRMGLQPDRSLRFSILAAVAILVAALPLAAAAAPTISGAGTYVENRGSNTVGVGEGLKFNLYTFISTTNPPVSNVIAGALVAGNPSYNPTAYPMPIYPDLWQVVPSPAYTGQYGNWLVEASDALGGPAMLSTNYLPPYVPFIPLATNASVTAGTTTPTVSWDPVLFAMIRFGIPLSVATDGSGNVYVTDPGGQQIQKFGGSGTYLARWGGLGTGNGQFDIPFGVAIDGVGNVYVADSLNHRIQKFDSSGNYLSQWGNFGTGNGQFNEPRGVAIDGVGNVYVADSLNHRIQKFDSSGNYLSQWGNFGTGNGQFNGPNLLATDGTGNVYVADTSNHRVQKFDGSGAYLSQWGNFGTGNGQFDQPMGIATDGSGNVYVSELGNSRVQVFDGSGTYLSQWGNLGTGNGQFRNPGGVAKDGSGNVYVADTNNNRIQKFDAGGNFISVWGGTGSGTTTIQEVTQYRVRIMTSALNQFFKSDLLPPGTTSFTVPASAGLAPGASYTARIEAVYSTIEFGAFESASSTFVDFTTGPAAPAPVITPVTTFPATDLAPPDTPPGSGVAPIPNGYTGLNWWMNYADAASMYASTGAQFWRDGVVTGPYVAFNSGILPTRIFGAGTNLFNFTGAYFSSGSPPSTLEITAYDEHEVIVYRKSVNLTDYKPKWVDAGFTGIMRLDLVNTVGEMREPAQFIMDNFNGRCEELGGDADGDGVCDSAGPNTVRDNCPATINPGQVDSDGDGVGDACDNCPVDANPGQDPAACATKQAITSTIINPLPVYKQGDPLLVRTCVRLAYPTLRQFLPDCFNTAFVMTDVTNPGSPVRLEGRCLIGPPYVIPTDLVPAGEYCITCDVTKRFPPDVTGVQDGTTKSFSVAPVFSSFVSDPEIDPATRQCTNAEVGCSPDIWTGVVRAPEVPVTLVGTTDTMARIAIKPGSPPPKPINIGASVIPVAILGSASFDVGTVNPLSITLENAGVKLRGKANTPMAAFTDINDDGFMDMVVQIDTTGIGLSPDMDSAIVLGQYTVGGVLKFFRGYDYIRVVP